MKKWEEFCGGNPSARVHDPYIRAYPSVALNMLVSKLFEGSGSFHPNTCCLICQVDLFFL